MVAETSAPDPFSGLLPYEKLVDKPYQQSLRELYDTAAPYPMVSIDGLFDDAVLQRVVAEFPDAEKLSAKFRNAREVKNGSRNEAEISAFTRTFIYHLNSAAFIEFMEGVTGIAGLIPDPHLWGGGLHVLPQGGKLALHADFNFHTRLKLDRRVNVLIYLNEDWHEEYGGWFEAWRPGGKQAEARYLPVFNRTVIFNTNDYTIHGNPDPVTCPDGRCRRSIAMYYYTNGRPEEEWTGIDHTTIFYDRPGETVANPPKWRARVMRMLPKRIRMAISKRKRAVQVRH